MKKILLSLIAAIGLICIPISAIDLAKLDAAYADAKGKIEAKQGLPASIKSSFKGLLAREGVAGVTYDGYPAWRATQTAAGETEAQKAERERRAREAAEAARAAEEARQRAAEAEAERQRQQQQQQAAGTTTKEPAWKTMLNDQVKKAAKDVGAAAKTVQGALADIEKVVVEALREGAK